MLVHLYIYTRIIYFASNDWVLSQPGISKKSTSLRGVAPWWWQIVGGTQSVELSNLEAEKKRTTRHKLNMQKHMVGVCTKEGLIVDISHVLIFLVGHLRHYLEFLWDDCLEFLLTISFWPHLLSFWMPMFNLYQESPTTSTLFGVGEIFLPTINLIGSIITRHCVRNMCSKCMTTKVLTVDVSVKLS